MLFGREGRGQLYNSDTLYLLCILVAPLGFLSTIAGWVSAESGRQPWIVYNLITTSEGASIVPLHQVIISLALLVTVYGIIFSFYLFYLFKLIRKGPTAPVMDESATEVITETPFKYLAPEGK